MCTAFEERSTRACPQRRGRLGDIYGYMIAPRSFASPEVVYLIGGKTSSGPLHENSDVPYSRYALMSLGTLISRCGLGYVTRAHGGCSSSDAENWVILVTLIGYLLFTLWVGYRISSGIQGIDTYILGVIA
jgi:hypothetical protein